MVEGDSKHDLDAKMLNRDDEPQKDNSAMAEWVVRVMIVIQYLFVFALIYTLATDGECEEPIRLWLNVLLISFIVNISLEFIIYTTSLTLLIECGKVLFDFFIFIWCIIGTVWFFQDDTCEATWYSGYIMSLVLIIFFFISSIPYFLCCFVICRGTLKGLKSS